MKYIIAAIVLCLLIILYIINIKEGFLNNTDHYIVDIAAGANHSLFLTKQGKIYTCGKNINGRLGTGNSSSVITPVSIEKTSKHIFAGNVNTFFLTDNNSLYATGENSQGQLGIGTLDNQFAPVPIPLFNNSIKIAKVAAGWYHTLFLTTTNEVYASGDNRYGQILNATTVPVKLTINCRDIAAGQGHSVFLTTDNKVYTSGWNWYGQLGNNSTRNSNTPVLINTGGNVQKIFAGMSSTFLLNSQGRVYVCGDNTNGQLGLSRNITNQRSFVLIPNLPNTIMDIFTGQSHTFFLTNNGEVYGVGSNEKGQLGIGHNNTIYIPEKINNHIFKKIAAGANHSIFLTKNGIVYASGDNTMGGQLGIKNITQTNTPELCDIELHQEDTGLLYKKDIVGV